MTTNEASETYAGQAVYSPSLLKIYDLYVLGFSNALVWRCPSSQLLEWYDRHIRDNHLDVGVGTGWFLDRCRMPSTTPRITLLDLNANSLAFTARRIRRYEPRVMQADVTTVDLGEERFDSIALNYLLHCLPVKTKLGSKWRVLTELARHVTPDGVLFGSTILGAGIRTNALQRALLSAYNRKGIFGNLEDSRENLEAALAEGFSEVNIEQRGLVALFSARRPRLHAT